MQKDSAKNRNKFGNVASLVGIFANLVLACSKIAVGVLFGVVSVLADGLNNLTDCGNSVVSLVSFKLSARPADKEHPYGHERIEYICSLVVAFLVAFVAIDMFKESIGKIISPVKTNFTPTKEYHLVETRRRGRFGKMT